MLIQKVSAFVENALDNPLGDIVPNKNAQKGTRWERELADYLTDQGHRTDRQKVFKGGDLIPLYRTWSLEAKDDSRKADLATAEQAASQVEADGVSFGVVIKKTRGKNAHHSTVHMTMETWLHLVDYVEELRWMRKDLEK